ncbi:EAL domain-containing protein [Massilia sp. RP-1-19]|uniref:EAL domain-containing protein n=1 Tax=Massilia polaris TaxID=2728846 RepID=A0A848HEW1_9BURK|nr:EAL domain-containing protein [Massilia polaris]NML60366.1 EAL domain-containing protein [Massilia polaris]
MSDIPIEDGSSTHVAGNPSHGHSLARALRAHRTISAGNRTLLRAIEEAELLHDMCMVAVEEGGYARAGVTYAGNGPDRPLHWMVWMGCEHGKAVEIDVDELNYSGYTWADTPLGQDATAIAIRTGKAFTRRNVLTGPVFRDPAYDTLRKRAEQGNYLSLTAFPLACDGEVIGALFMAAADSDAFDEQEIGLLSELAADLAFGIHTLRMRREHDKAQETIRRLTLFDPATGLPNRAGLLLALREQIAAASQSQGQLAVLYLGVEKFDEIGNALGQEVCDCLMRGLAARIASYLPHGTPVATPGEGEFAIILHDADLERALEYARAVLAVLAAPVEAVSALIAPQVAAGISLYPEHATGPESLARRASAAMHMAQRTSIGVAVYRAGHDEEVANRLVMMGRLRSAIERGEFEFYCQPKVDIRTCKPCGAEALIRWRDPVHGLVGPATFIPLAEQSGLITSISGWMIETAFCQVHAWSQAGFASSLSVNLSAHDIQDPALIGRIRQFAATWAVPDKAIQFELTESALMDDPETAIRSMARLNDMGFQIWLDDFGTGYSSLSYLQRFPIHAIKIDQSFVRAMIVDSGSNAIVHATIDLGHHLGLHVVAEGVEDRAVWTRLAEYGCDIAQGFFVAQPMPVAHFRDWNADWHSREPGWIQS